jgi:hypothetical protein
MIGRATLTACVLLATTPANASHAARPAADDPAPSPPQPQAPTPSPSPPVSPSPSPTVSVAIANPAPAPRRWFVHFNFGFNVYTYNGATSASAAQHLTPASRVNLGQQIGAGYYVHPNVRIQLTFQFGENLTGVPSGSGRFALFAIVPQAVLTLRGAFVGLGPFLAPRAFGKNEFELGAFISGGYTWKLPHNVGFSVAVQSPVTFLHRFSAQVTPLVSASYRF